MPDSDRFASTEQTLAAKLPVLWSIQRLLIIGILSLEIVTVGWLALATYLGARSALSDSYQSLVHQLAADTVAHSQDLLISASAAVVAARNQIEDGAVDPHDQERLAQLLFAALKADVRLAGLYYGSSDGNFVYVMREHPGASDEFRVKTIRVHDGQHDENVVLHNRHWVVVRDLKLEPDDFQPTERPWYRKALELGGDGWTAPYKFYTSERWGISFARTVNGPQGQMQGVVGGDIELNDIAGYIASLRIGTNSHAMIATRDVGLQPATGVAVASDSGPARLRPLTPTNDQALMKALGRVNAAEAGGVLTLPAIYRFGSDGARYFAVAAPFAKADLPWVLLIAVPEADYLGWFYAAQRSTLLVALNIGVVGVAVGLLMWHGLATPLKRLRQNAVAVRLGRWDELQSSQSRFAEVRETEAAFQSMADFLSSEQAANAALMLRLHKLAAAVEQSPAAILITDAAGVIEYANPAFGQLTLHPAATIVGQGSIIMAPGPEAQTVYDDIVRSLADGLIWRGERATRRADGSLFNGSFVIAPVRNAAGLATNWVVIIEDVTEARAHTHEISKALDVAVAANQARAEFLAHMSHDLRTPLNAILGFSEVMRDELFGPLGDPRYRSYVEDIWASGDYLLQIVTQILEIARAESATLTLIDSEIKLVELVETIQRLVMYQTAGRHISLTVSIPPDLTVRADPTKLHQVVVNLVSNAVKFTDEGGSIAITATLPPTGGVELRIADTGHGMTAKQIELALQPFMRVENNPMARKTDGVGLGLPIAQRLIQLHGGSLTFDSEPGRGTTVIVWLPEDRKRPASDVLGLI